MSRNPMPSGGESKRYAKRLSSPEPSIAITDTLKGPTTPPKMLVVLFVSLWNHKKPSKTRQTQMYPIQYHATEY